MGREVRMVPPDWQHPRDEHGRYIPLHTGDGEAELQQWIEARALWQRGEHPDQATWPEDKGLTYSQWTGGPPNPDEYMPDWPREKRTHFQMYEDTSEGTPISPVMETPEALARWLADNGASAFGAMTATYEQWLSTIQRGWACGMVMDARGVQSGVAGLAAATPPDTGSREP